MFEIHFKIDSNNLRKTDIGGTNLSDVKLTNTNYSSSYIWFAWRPVRLGFIGKGAIVWLRYVRRCHLGNHRFYEAIL